MNLRAVHILFIVAATALAALFGAWCFRNWQTEGGAGSLAGSAGGFAAVAILVVYGTWFVRKSRGL